MGEGDLGTVPLFLSHENRSGSGEGSNRYIPCSVQAYLSALAQVMPFFESACKGSILKNKKENFKPLYIYIDVCFTRRCIVYDNNVIINRGHSMI